MKTRDEILDHLADEHRGSGELRQQFRDDLERLSERWASNTESLAKVHQLDHEQNADDLAHEHDEEGSR